VLQSGVPHAQENFDACERWGGASSNRNFTG